MNSTIPEPPPRSPHKLADDIYQGLGGLYAAAKGIALQAHKRSFDDYTHDLERGKRIGYKILGHDIPQIDRDIAEQRGAGTGEDVDSSVNISGDTHIHVAPGQPLPNVINQPGKPPKIDPGPQPAPQPPPPQPQPAPQPPQVKPNGTPAWLKWALAAAIGASAAGPALTAYFMRPTPTDGGGSVFAFETELPPWMDNDDAP